MTYLLEQLGDERFQQLSQALLVAAFPNTQCLPVGQPDGGRDAYSRSPKTRASREELAIYQVKYVKNPSTKDARELIESVVRGERAKVTKLISKGATSYHLITNASGTSHLDSGSIDKVEKTLTQEFGIPAYCWWRDDVERRIDALPAVKWSYPEIIRATDLLEVLVLGSGDPDMKRRSDTIRAYMAHQAKLDSQLKFKQIDLQKSISELFVDVPSKVLRRADVDEREHQESWLQFFKENSISSLKSADEYQSRQDFAAGALEVMVSRGIADKAPRIVVEGAPGQGKSTVTQYLCQVHRLKLLNRTAELSKVDPRHRPTSARIPFRVDLRDYANWISGKNPFVDEGSDPLPVGSTPVLESFIAAQVHRQTGAAFGVDDLKAISSISQILIVLDGFDEVADIRIRNRIVEEVSAASERISETAISSQVVVTSRPAVFANSPGFSREEWQYIEILPLVRSAIDLYADKWLRGRGVDRKERQAVTSVLSEKLSLSHVRDLARNPMQLAILLSLISVQGSSLPDKRTELYDNYVDIFLNREAEKSQIVRDHRPLLVSIHRYLAWLLHSEAEDSAGAGNIGENRLKEVLRTYLEDGGHNPGLVDQLFTGMVERVVALVSRVQGTFEFEVQPLREYFAARHLYDTAKYSPGSKKTKGTKPDRFDALVRNFYWLNVTRFYAGCYSSGELASLIDGFEDLLESRQFRHIGYTAQLGATLLGDYVFSLHPKLAKKLAVKITESPSFRIRMSELSVNGRSESLIMPNGGGRDVLVDYARNEIKTNPLADRVEELARVIVDNLSADEAISLWKDLQGDLDEKTWMSLGERIDVVNSLDKAELVSYLENYGGKSGYQSLAQERPEVYAEEPGLWSKYYHELICGGYQGFPLSGTGAEDDENYLMASALSRLLWAYALSSGPAAGKRASVYRNISRYFYPANERSPSKDIDCISGSGYLKGVYGDLPEILALCLSQSWGEFTSGASEFPAVLESCRRYWGASWKLTVAAMNFAYIAEKPEVAISDIFDENLSLCQRAIYACNQSDVAWWRENLVGSREKDELSRMFVVGCAFRALDIAAFCSIHEEIDLVVSSVSSDAWANYVDKIRIYKQRGKMSSLLTPRVVAEMGFSSRFAALIIPSLNKSLSLAVWKTYLASAEVVERDVLYQSANFMVSRAIQKPSEWDAALSAVALAYSNGVIPHLSILRSGAVGGEYMQKAIAERVCTESSRYPSALVAMASSVLSAQTGAEAIGLGKVAARDEWFDE